MKSDEYKEIMAMLAVIYKKIDTVERKMKGSALTASMQHYMDELRSEAAKIDIK